MPRATVFDIVDLPRGPAEPKRSAIDAMNPFKPPLDAVLLAAAADDSMVRPIPRSISTWSAIGVLIHCLLILNWKVTTYVPWAIPNIEWQVLVSILGLCFHSLAFGMAKRDRWRFPQHLLRGRGMAYFALMLLLFGASLILASLMVGLDQQKYQEHLDRIRTRNTSRMRQNQAMVTERRWSPDSHGNSTADARTSQSLSGSLS